MAEARSLADIKLDNAYKFGAGRYLQEAGALNLLGGEVARLGKKALVIAGPRAWAATEGKAEKSLKDAGVEFELSLYPDQNTYERAKEHALQALTTGCQVIVGIGGGRIMDGGAAHEIIAQQSGQVCQRGRAGGTQCGQYKDHDRIGKARQCKDDAQGKEFAQHDLPHRHRAGKQQLIGAGAAFLCKGAHTVSY